MGNCCGKLSSASDDLPASRPSGGKSQNFQGQGRTLGGAPTSSNSNSKSNPNSLPSSTSTGPARAQLPNSLATTPAPGPNAIDPVETVNDPKAAAARAAEQRAQTATGPGKGKLGRALDAQKSQTQTEILAARARENLAARDADAAAQARNWD